MTKIKIKEIDNLKINKQIKEYLNPDYVYIPYDQNVKLNIKSNEYVLIGKLLYEGEKNTYSPISGTIIGSCENLVDNKKKECIVIENDFKEKKTKTISNKKNLNKEELISILKEYGYNYNLNGDTLLINGIDNEPYEYTSSYITSTYTENILDGIDLLINILKIKKCYLTIKNSDETNVETLINQIGTYPNIELNLLEDYYPEAHPKILTDKFKKKDNKIVYLTVEDIYYIYNSIKKQISQNEKFITVTDTIGCKSKVLKVKIGTRIADILNNNFKITYNDYNIVINGLLSGYEINTLNAIITPNIRSIFISKPKNLKQTKCINCGLCYLNCPVKADPRTGYNMNKCLKCGLCNYICPSKIQVSRWNNE